MRKIPIFPNFFSLCECAKKAQARLCICINSTELSLLENVISNKFPVFVSLSIMRETSLYIITGLAKMSKLLSADRRHWRGCTFAQARLIHRCLTVVKFASLAKGRFSLRNGN